MSEASDENYVAAGVLAQTCLYLLVAIGLWLFRRPIDSFVGSRVTWFLIAMLAGRLAVDLITNILDGQRLVHISSLLSPLEWTSRSIVQVALVLGGFGIGGAFGGYVAGTIVAVSIGSYFVTFPRSFPSRRAFVRLKSFAQFSWLSGLRSRAFASMDTVILAFFVSNSLIAVYEVAWNLASLFAIFGHSIQRTLFPEISRMSASEGSLEEVSELLRVNLVYSGLLTIPGLVGSVLVGDVVLTIYGAGFENGYYVLLIHIFSQLLNGYMYPFKMTIDALDEPRLTFYLDVGYLGANLILNVLLVWQFGWIGAAVATTLSSGIGLLGGYYLATKILDVVLPFRELAKQCVAAAVMAVVVLAGRLTFGDSLPLVVVLVTLGATVFFTTLFGISREFRTTVVDNLPFAVPVLPAK